MAWNLTTKVFATTSAIVSVVVGAALVIGSASLRRASDETSQRRLEQATELVAQFLDGRERSLAGGVRVFVQAPYFRTLVAERRREDLLDQSIEAAGQLDAKWVMITDNRGILLAKSDEPTFVSDSLSGVALIDGALRGGTTTGFGVSHDTSLFQAVAVPIAIPGAASIGVLVATRLIDSQFARDVRIATASDLVFYARDSHGDLRISTSTVGGDSDVVAAAELLAQQAPSASTARPKIRIHKIEYFAQAAALATAGGEPIGGFMVLRPRDAEPSNIADVRRSLFIAGALGLVLALAFAYVAAQRITRPVRALAQAVRRAADGDYDPGALTAASDSSDAELMSLTQAYGSLLADLRDKETLVQTLASSNDGAAAADSAPMTRTVGVSATAGSMVRRIGLAKSARSMAALKAGDVLNDRYRIEAQVGSGGMGIVYRAMDQLLHEPVAVKVLRPEVVAADPSAFERFTEELRLARRITHRNVVRTHDLAECDGVPFLTMEYVHGASLASIIASRGALPAATVVSIGKQLLRALAVAHEQHVIHGDLKPQNVLIAASGVLKVTDFGVARLIRNAVPERRAAAQSSAPPRLAGAVIGTPEYLAPEVLVGEPATAAADIYSIGVVLHECLVGSTPYQSDTPAAFITRKLDTSVRTPAPDRAPAIRVHDDASGHGSLERRLEECVARMTRPNPRERPSSAAELAEKFSAMVDTGTRSSQPVAAIRE